MVKAKEKGMRKNFNLLLFLLSFVVTTMTAKPVGNDSKWHEDNHG